ncbi:MAG: hypothetical protein GEU73_04020 [Chloroflexi bacterium]|nr:hypothetical protein [Chloroflexota bacterium]
MKFITPRADARLIEEARERARQEHTTLNEQFRRWLADYVGRRERAEQAMRTIRDLQTRIRLTDLPLTRDELNER